MSLSNHLAVMYSADALGRGSFPVALAAFRTALASDDALKTEATETLARLKNVDQARAGNDHITKKQVKYLEEALTNG